MKPPPLLAALVAAVALSCGSQPRPEAKPVPRPRAEPARPDSRSAVAALDRAGARLERDAEQPGRPVVGVALRNVTLDEALVKHLAGLPRLRSLELYSTPATGTGLAGLSGLKTLDALTLEGGSFGDPALATVAGLSRLRRLDLRGSAITDGGLKSLAGLTRLQALNLRGTAVTGAGLKHLARLTDLRGLDLTWTHIGDDALAALAPFAELRELRLAKTARASPPITDAGLPSLAKLRKLERLDLSGNRRVTHSGMGVIGGLTGLVTLDLSDTGIDERALARLGGLKNLSTLDLAGTRVSGLGLSGLTSLEDLNLARSSVRDAALASFKGLPKLKSLRLDFTAVTDQGIEALAELPALASLDLWGVKRLTEDCLGPLKRMKQLRLLKLSPDREHLTEERIEELRKALPRTRIET